MKSGSNGGGCGGKYSYSVLRGNLDCVALSSSSSSLSSSSSTSASSSSSSSLSFLFRIGSVFSLSSSTSSFSWDGEYNGDDNVSDELSGSPEKEKYI